MTTTFATWSHAEWPLLKAPLTVAEARNWVGLFGDASLDDELTACLNAAVEKVSSFVGYKVAKASVVDHFSGLANDRMALSEPGVDVSTLEVKYRNTSGNEIAVADTEYFVDKTSKRIAVVWNEGAFPDDVSVYFVNPVTIAYETDISEVQGSHVLERLSLGVRLATEWFWQNRAVLNPAPHLLDRSLYSLLDSCRLENDYDPFA